MTNTTESITKSKTVYVLIEEDRGCGPTIIGVYLNKEEAEKECEEWCSSYIEESELI